MSEEREDGRILKPAKDSGPPQPGPWDDFERLLTQFHYDPTTSDERER